MLMGYDDHGEAHDGASPLHLPLVGVWPFIMFAHYMISSHSIITRVNNVI